MAEICLDESIRIQIIRIDWIGQDTDHLDYIIPIVWDFWINWMINPVEAGLSGLTGSLVRDCALGVTDNGARNVWPMVRAMCDRVSLSFIFHHWCEWVSAKLSAKATAKSGCSSHEKKKQLQQQQQKKVAVAASYNNNISCSSNKKSFHKKCKKKWKKQSGRSSLLSWHTPRTQQNKTTRINCQCSFLSR